MMSCNLQGGLGNLLFQVATTNSLALDNNDKCLFNTDNFMGGNYPQEHPNKYLDNIFLRMRISNDIVPIEFNVENVYNEPSFSYNKIPYYTNMYLNGYFQSEKYFKHNREYILNLFRPDEHIAEYIDTKYGDILKKEETISIHIRRGDYLEKEDRHPVCRMEYYEAAIKCFDTFNSPIFIIFSDDLEWCKKHFTGDNYIFIQGEEDYIDLYLMSLCKHNIIANSSFSWWGAWLNKNINKKVIAPQNWFGVNKRLPTQDIYCEGWEVL